MPALATKKLPDTGHDPVLIARLTLDLHLSGAAGGRFDEAARVIGEGEVLARVARAVTDALTRYPETAGVSATVRD